MTAVAYWGNGLCPSPRSVFLFLIGSKAHAGTRAESEPLHPAPYPDAGWSSAPTGFQIDPDTMAGTMFQFRVAGIRKLIERKRAELEQQGVCATVAQIHMGAGQARKLVGNHVPVLLPPLGR